MIKTKLYSNMHAHVNAWFTSLTLQQLSTYGIMYGHVNAWHGIKIIKH